MTPVPPVTVQLPPLLTESVTVTPLMAYGLGFCTVIVPLTFQLRSVTPLGVTVTP